MGDTNRDVPMPGARRALTLLIAINLFNYIDRYILAAVLPLIGLALLPANDPLAGTKLGALTPAFMISYMIFSPIFGWLADRTSRWLLVAVGVIIWSLASGASGLAGDFGPFSGFVILFLTRCFVGIGEAVYGPVAPTLISDLYPVQRRGSVMAWFYMAIPVGGALGFVLGGTLGEALGWRWPFYLVVPPGILLGICCLLMKEPQRGRADALVDGPITRPGWREYSVLLRTPSYVLCTLGMTAMTFSVGGVSVWMPTYIYEREARLEITPEVLQRLQGGLQPVPAPTIDKLRSLAGRPYFNVPEFEAQLERLLTPEELQRHRERLLDDPRALRLGETGLIFGAIVAVAGITATLLGGIAGDVLRRRWAGAYFIVSGIGMLLALPFYFLILITPLPWSWLFIFCAVFFLFFNTGPTNTILANVTHPAIRATAFAMNIFIIHALGDAISPLAIGAIKDGFQALGYDVGDSLSVAFQIVSVLIIASAVLWLWGTRYLRHDTETAPQRLQSKTA